MNRVLPAIIAACVGGALVLARRQVAEFIVHHQSQMPWGRYLGDRALGATKAVTVVCGVALVLAGIASLLKLPR